MSNPPKKGIPSYLIFVADVKDRDSESIFFNKLHSLNSNTGRPHERHTRIN